MCAELIRGWCLISLKNVFLQNIYVISVIVPYYFCIVFKSVKAIYIYASVKSRYALSENGIAQYALTYCFGDIEGLTLTNFVKLMLSQHIFWYFNCLYFMNGGSDPCKPYHFLKECNDNFQMHIYKLFQQTQVSCWEQHKIKKNELFLTI